jgi:SPP1 family predicted phage head-tail adaptor
MDRRLTVQARTLTKDAAGGRVETWADAFDCWGEVVTQKASEGVTADADRATDDLQFRIRYKSGITSGTHRILYQLKFYDITGIVEEGRRDRLLLTCRSVQSLTHA